MPQKEEKDTLEDAKHHLMHVGIVTIVAIFALTMVFYPPNFNSFGFAVKKQMECSDGLDNDADTLVDWPSDPGCYGPRDDVETEDFQRGLAEQIRLRDTLRKNNIRYTTSAKYQIPTEYQYRYTKKRCSWEYQI